MTPPPRGPRSLVQSFEPAPFGYAHVDLKPLPRLQGQAAYVFVAIERTPRFVHVEIVPERSGATAAACLERLLQASATPCTRS